MSLLSRLWSNARDALNRLCATLLPLDTLVARERRELRQRLCALEAFVRRVVLLEALNLKAGISDRAPSEQHSERSQRGLKGAARRRRPRLRLWPRAAPPRARIRQLGPPVLVRDIWREQRRAALIARLRAARGRRRPSHILIADRIDALDAIIAAPLPAARRLARKLVHQGNLALKLALARPREAPGVNQALHDELRGAIFRPALNSS